MCKSANKIVNFIRSLSSPSYTWMFIQHEMVFISGLGLSDGSSLPLSPDVLYLHIYRHLYLLGFVAPSLTVAVCFFNIDPPGLVAALFRRLSA